MAAESIRVREFLSDLLPFFYGRRLTYVDVGAFEGKIFHEVLAAGLQVREAHLFEPNEESLKVAKESTAKLFKGNSLNFYHLAVGSTPTKVRMRPARSMTKVITGKAKPAANENESVFEVECTTLDRMIDSFGERHISLLKVDVEGFELEVLAGASRALADQAIDVVYIEAGMNPRGTQQCYYRDIEDALRAHGYSLYKIYEQQHEWIEDSPLLRRVNLAFMSPKFAASSPYRVTSELFQAQKEIKDLKARAESSAARIAALEQSGQATAETLAEAEKSASTQKAECDRLKQALAKADQAANARASERDSLRTRAAELESKLAKAESASAALLHERTALGLQMEILQRAEETLSSKLAAGELQLASASVELERLRSAEHARKELAERLAASELRVSELAAERDRQRDALASAADAAKVMAAERATLAKDLEVVAAERSAFAKALDLMTAKRTAFANDLEVVAAERTALTKDLQVVAAERSALAKDLAAAMRRIAELSADRDMFDSKLTDLKKSHAAISNECTAQAGQLEKNRAEARKAEEVSREVFKFIAQLHRRELKAIKEGQAARADADRMRASAAYKLAESLIGNADSPSRRLRAQFALWRELKRLREVKEPTPEVIDVLPVLVISAEKPSAALPLTLKPHVVRLASANGSRELWARIVGSDPDMAADVELLITGNTAGQGAPVSKTVRVHARSKQKLIDSIDAGAVTELQVRRTNGDFSLLVLDVIPAPAPSDRGPSSSRGGHQKTITEMHSAKTVRSSGDALPPAMAVVGATIAASGATHAIAQLQALVVDVEQTKQPGLSYEAKIKPVPERPAELPVDLVLPPLRGVANDYSFIEAACRQRWADGKRDYTMPVSIVIPVYNRSCELDFVLAGLLHQTYPRELMEIVIADDGSKEDLALVYRKYEGRLQIRYCWQEDLGYHLAEARNLGIATASHDSIIILDSDAIPSPGLVEEYMRRFHVERNIAMFGLRHYVSVENIDVGAFASDARVLDNAPRVQSENSVATKAAPEGHSTDWREKPIRDTDLLKSETLPYRFLVGANCGFSRELFDKVGGYSDAFRAWGFEDQEFGYRLNREGAYFIPLMDAYVYHQEPLSGKNDTDRKLGRAVTRDIFIQKCPFVYRKRSMKGPFEVPLVSIYVPLYNRERHIVECIESALAQTVEDLEVVVCDDGSTDRSAELINKHFGGDRRVRLITQKNGGIAAASNTAVRAARGFYIGQLDADDVLKRDAVEQCLKVMEQNPRLSLVYGTTEYIDDNSAVLQEGWNWPRFTREYLITRMICHHFRFFRKRDWARTAGFNEQIRNAVDYDMMLKLAETGEVVHLNRVLYQYRKHAATTTTQENGLQTQNNYIAINDSLRRMNITHYTAVPDASRHVERAVKFTAAESPAATSSSRNSLGSIG